MKLDKETQIGQATMSLASMVHTHTHLTPQQNQVMISLDDGGDGDGGHDGGDNVAHTNKA